MHRLILRRLILGAALLMTAAAANVSTVERGHDPWVFRCVLDKHARMAVVAISKPLWICYDATDCTMKEAWHG
ncbi:MAG TPA: hypothetical protein VG711_07630, partial [Phycisphaerales bacterium]|nr:hypothetical protein [Phycisphaerales bacterium]